MLRAKPTHEGSHKTEDGGHDLGAEVVRPAAGLGAVAAAWLAIAAVEAVQPAPIGSELPSGALFFAGLNGVGALTLLPFRAWFRTFGVVVCSVVGVVTFFGLLAGDNTALAQGWGSVFFSGSSRPRSPT
jgi:hypothetical protein